MDFCRKNMFTASTYPILMSILTRKIDIKVKVIAGITSRLMPLKILRHRLA